MIYLDNAATSFPKPLCVPSEITRCIRTYCGNPGRSGHSMSIKAAEKIFDCRQLLADFFDASSPENVVFTLNTTHALNIAIKTLYKKGSHILISNMEHNSVLRPIASLEKKGEISYGIFNAMQPASFIIKELEQRKKANTDMLIMTHASNICGAVFPIREIGEFCKRNNITFIVDAAQSAGVEDISIKKCHIGALCAPAHKSMYGPQGLGFVIFGNRLPKRTIIEGGNGTNSLSFDMGTALPESFEGGTMPTPLIAGLYASASYIKRVGIEKISSHEKQLAAYLYDMLCSLPQCRLYGPKKIQNGIILFGSDKLSQNALSNALNEKGICTRSGFHCTPLAHNTLGTPHDGATRISFGYFNTQSDAEAVYKTVKSLM